MKLTNDMLEALADLARSVDGVRGPSNTGVSTNTYKALANRGLLNPHGWRKWTICDRGREVIREHLSKL